MVYTASRLSEGNKLFPAEIHTEESGLTVKIPGLFKGDSQYFDYNQISSVSVEKHFAGFPTITFYAAGARISAHGFSSSDVEDIKKSIENGKSGQGNYSQNSQSEHIIVETEAVQLRKLELERERELERKQRNKELLQFAQKNWKILLPIVVVIIGLVTWYFTFRYKPDTTAEDSVKINLQLEKIEDTLKTEIGDRDKDKAMILVNKLVHPYHVLWEGKSHLLTQIYYDDYWNDKREYYKNQITKIGIVSNKTSKKKHNQNSQTSVSTQNSITNSGNVSDKNEVVAKFASAELFEGVGSLIFKKSDGTTISFARNFMNDKKLLYNFLDENGQSNEALVGKPFLIKWKEVKEANDATGSMELVNKIISIKQQ